MKKLFILSILILTSLSIKPQTKKIDSLYKVLEHAKPDTNQVKTLTALAFDLIELSDYKKAEIINNKAVVISNKIGYKKGLISVLINTGNSYGKQGEYEKSMAAYLQALELSKQINYLNFIPIIIANMGIQHYSKSNFTKALQCFFEASKLYENLNDKVGLCHVTSNIGNIYYQQNNYLKALEYHTKGLKMSEELGDSNEIAISKSVPTKLSHKKQANFINPINDLDEFNPLSTKDE